MNDRFRFRVWDEKSKKYYDKDFYVLCDGSGAIYTPSDEEEKLCIEQCTGLKDKNGNLIYEGDILKQPGLPYKVVCEWFKDGFWLNGFANGAKRELRNMHSWYEVIGNINEKTDLIKVGENDT